MAATKHFRKVLIANRGEIALRVIRSLREMGIASVAVYSEADRLAMHVREADEAQFIGPALVSESYLNVDAVLAACKQSGAEAVHPGYGFLSEDADFARACAKAGIEFIGPGPEAIDAMGLKIEARRLMQSAGVPTVPGMELGEGEDLKTAAQRAANQVGFPLLVKASAGGGGKGMRHVNNVDEVGPAVERARSEAQNAFGDGTVYLERLLVNARHIEVQVLGDAHGNYVHVFERDCSIQRRHQKVVEESPAPAGALSETLRAKLHQGAVQAARAVNYRSAGTIECLVSGDDYYFLEMNTRLQVEHPVSELVSGLDLVREQIRVAQGEPLGFTQNQLSPRGHAIEVRLYAEDPELNFMPSPGPLTYFHLPTGPGIRVDTGFESGDVVSQFYDPMIAKLCVWAQTRELAVKRLQRALSETRVLGLRSNLSFLRQIAHHPDFVSGHYDIQWLERTMSTFASSSLSEADKDRLAVAAVLASLDAKRKSTITHVAAPIATNVEIPAWRQLYR